MGKKLYETNYRDCNFTITKNTWGSLVLEITKGAQSLIIKDNADENMATSCDNLVHFIQIFRENISQYFANTSPDKIITFDSLSAINTKETQKTKNNNQITSNNELTKAYFYNEVSFHKERENQDHEITEITEHLADPPFEFAIKPSKTSQKIIKFSFDITENELSFSSSNLPASNYLKNLALKISETLPQFHEVPPKQLQRLFIILITTFSNTGHYLRAYNLTDIPEQVRENVKSLIDNNETSLAMLACSYSNQLIFTPNYLDDLTISPFNYRTIKEITKLTKNSRIKVKLPKLQNIASATLNELSLRFYKKIYIERPFHAKKDRKQR